jgi:hypothetical protein
MISHADAERLLAEERHRRSAAVHSYLATISQLGQLIDRLGELHADLAADDRLQQSLHALGFVWGYVEGELRMAACDKS